MFQALKYLIGEFIKWLEKKTIIYEPYKPRMYGDKKGGDYDD